MSVVDQQEIILTWKLSKCGKFLVAYPRPYSLKKSVTGWTAFYQPVISEGVYVKTLLESRLTLAQAKQKAQDHANEIRTTENRLNI